MNNKFLSNFSWMIMAKVIQMVIQLLLGTFIARYLGPGDYGTINYVASFIAFFSTITMLGSNGILVNELIKSENNEKEIGKKLGSITFARLFCGLISSIFIIIIMFTIKGSNSQLILITLLQSISLWFVGIDTISYWFQARQELKYSAIIQLVAYIILALYKIILLMMEKSVVWFAFANSIDIMVMAILYIIIYYIYGGPRLRFDINYLKIFIKNSYHFIIAGIMIIIYTQTDKIMIGSMCDDTSVGLYSAVVVICNLWNVVVTSILDSVRPIIMSYKAKKSSMYEKRLTQTIAALMYLGIFCGIVIYIFAEIILWILYGKEYIEAANTLRIAVWYTSFSNIGSVLHIYLVCEEKEKYVKGFCGVGAIINIILNIILIPKLGIVGAAIATLITQFFTNVILTYIIKDTREFFKYFIKSFGEIKASIYIIRNIKDKCLNTLTNSSNQSVR